LTGTVVFFQLAALHDKISSLFSDAPIFKRFCQASSTQNLVQPHLASPSAHNPRPFQKPPTTKGIKTHVERLNQFLKVFILNKATNVESGWGN